MKNFEVIASKTVFEGRIFDVKDDTIRFDNGLVAGRELVAKRDGAAAVIALDGEGRLLLVEQYRYGAQQDLLEIPAGLLEKGEEPEQGALRELEEETGWKAGKITFLYDFWATPGYCSEKLSVFLCEDLVKTHQHLDADEFINVKAVTLEEARAMVMDGRITDGKTIAAVFTVLNIKE